MSAWTSALRLPACSGLCLCSQSWSPGPSPHLSPCKKGQAYTVSLWVLSGTEPCPAPALPTLSLYGKRSKDTSGPLPAKPTPAEAQAQAHGNGKLLATPGPKLPYNIVSLLPPRCLDLPGPQFLICKMGPIIQPSLQSRASCGRPELSRPVSAEKTAVAAWAMEVLGQWPGCQASTGCGSGGLSSWPGSALTGCDLHCLRPPFSQLSLGYALRR